MTLTVVNNGINGITQLSLYTISVPKNGKLQDLTRALGIACSLGLDETLLVVEKGVYCGRKKNVEAAIEVGIKGVHFKSVDLLCEELSLMGIEITADADHQ
ncbi:hypothetical protein AHAS_Ahas13G0179200 [Arachis hypogaea]